MKAVRFFGVEDVRVGELPTPEILNPDDVLVKVRVSAICGSDLHLYRGQMPGLEPGMVIGHEYVGEVAAVGDAVRRVKPRDRVVGTFHLACGSCPLCRLGAFHQCQNGGVLGYGLLFGNYAGTQAEYVRVPFGDVNLRIIPAEVTDDKAIFCGDIFTTAYGAVRNSGLQPGETCVVIGAGPVGLMALMSARLFGASRVFCVDRDTERALTAEALGAIPVASSTTNPVRKIMQATGSLGADVVIEAVGGPETLNLAFQLVRGGGRISAVGVTSQAEMTFPLTTALTRDLTFRIGLANIHRDIDTTLKLVQSGRVDPSVVVSHHMPLEDAPLGYALFHRHQASKVLLTV